MPIQRHHPLGIFDAGHCQACAVEAGLLDHYDRVRREEARLRQAQECARTARRYALWALASSGIGVLLAVVAVLTG